VFPGLEWIGSLSYKIPATDLYTSVMTEATENIIVEI
jgi:hypothetical protein